MLSLVDQLRRVRWLAVPLAAYLVITLLLPAMNGAAARADFARHATTVIASCIAALALVVSCNVLVDLVRRRP